MIARLTQAFPTRIYPYRRGDAPAGLAAPADTPLLPRGVFQFRMGRDPRPTQIASADVSANFADPFAKLLLSQDNLPLSLRSLLAELDKQNSNPNGLPIQRSFLVADGGKIPWTPETRDLRR